MRAWFRIEIRVMKLANYLILGNLNYFGLRIYGFLSSSYFNKFSRLQNNIFLLLRVHCSDGYRV